MKILGKPHTKFAQDERKIKELKEKNKEQKFINQVYCIN